MNLKYFRRLLHGNWLAPLLNIPILAVVIWLRWYICYSMSLRAVNVARNISCHGTCLWSFFFLWDVQGFKNDLLGLLWWRFEESKMNQASKWLSDSLRKSLLGISIASKVVRIFTSSVSSYYRIVMVCKDYFVSHGHIYLGTKLTQPIMIAEIDALQRWFFHNFIKRCHGFHLWNYEWKTKKLIAQDLKG